MKKIILLLFIIFCIGCGVKKNSFNEYDDFNSYMSNFKFENIHALDYEIEFNELKNKASLDFSNDIYYLRFTNKNENYKAYYYENISYIDNGINKYKKETLRNAYRNMLKKYIHIDFDSIDLTGIEKIERIDNGYKVIFNDIGSFLYMNDILKRYDKYLQKPDFKNGRGYIIITNINGKYHFESEVSVNEYFVKEVINTRDVEEFEFNQSQFD